MWLSVMSPGQVTVRIYDSNLKHHQHQYQSPLYHQYKTPLSSQLEQFFLITDLPVKIFRFYRCNCSTFSWLLCTQTVQRDNRMHNSQTDGQYSQKQWKTGPTWAFLEGLCRESAAFRLIVLFVFFGNICGVFIIQCTCIMWLYKRISCWIIMLYGKKWRG